MAYRPIPDEVRQQVTSLLGQGLTDVEIARRLGGRVSRTTVARLRRQHEARTQPPIPTPKAEAAEAVQAIDRRMRASIRQIVPSPLDEMEERRHVPRRTYAWYVPEELGEAVREQAAIVGVAPSVVVEWLLAKAQRAGWLLDRDQLDRTRRYREAVEELHRAVAAGNQEEARKILDRMMGIAGAIAFHQLRVHAPSFAGDGEEAPGDGTPATS